MALRPSFRDSVSFRLAGCPRGVLPLRSPVGLAAEGRGLVPDEFHQRLVKTGGRLVKHARYYWLLLAESHLTRRLFASMLGRIDELALPSG